MPALNEEKQLSRRGFFRFVILILSVCMMLGIVAIFLYLGRLYYGNDLSRAGHTSSKKKLEIVIGNNVLKVPENVIRFANQRQNGVQQKINLYLLWPSLSGYKDELKNAFSDLKGDTNLIFISLEPRTMSNDMSGRLKPIYSLFFDGIGVKEENGLVRQALTQEGGFYDEDLYYQPDNAYPFVTRCVRETPGVGEPYCIRDVHLGKNLSVTYRFHKRFLGQWLELDEAIRTYVKSLLAN